MDSRDTLVLRFFHFRARRWRNSSPGTRVRCYGEAAAGQHGLEMVHPSYRVLGEDDAGQLRESLDPVYPAIEGLGPQTLRQLIARGAASACRRRATLELLPAATAALRWSCRRCATRC